MKNRKKISFLKKKSVLITFVIGLLLGIGFIFSFPKFFKSIPIHIENKENEKKEEKKIQIIDENSNTRPIAVMINNLDVARKYHAGLQDAYLVYEMVVEGGITRLMALYKDANTAKIGSVRSARHYYLDYALESDAIYVHWGYSEYAMNDIPRLGINNINGLSYGNVYFWRDKSLPVASEHTGFTSMELINKGIEKLGYRKTTETTSLLNYSVDEIDLMALTDAIPAQKIDIKYSASATTSYVYDEEAKNYKRSVNNTPHSDYVTKEQYTAKNIITYQVPNKTIKGGTKGRQDLNNIGKGTGYFISNGYAVPITWEKTSRSAKTVYKLSDGTILKVNDGNTYIQIQPSGQKLTIS